MIRRLMKYALLSAVPTLAHAQTTELFATQVELQDVWTNETNAQGAPATPACLDTAVNYARNPAGSDTRFLKALAFQPFAIPAGKMITAVSVDVLCRYDNNGHSGAVDVRVLRNGVELTTVTSSFFNNSNITDCRWLVGSVGNVTALADWVHNPSWINEIDVWVRRSTTTPQNQTMLKVKAFKIVVTMTDDSDGDFVPNGSDNCPSVSNSTQQNSDGDGLGDACDNCDFVSNQSQSNADGDAWGDACDNCVTTFQGNQVNSDNDSAGDACDNCDFTTSTNQADQDGDGLGDICDPCPSTVTCDCNGNGVPDSTDRIQHPEWDQNGDGVLDQCMRPVAVADLMSVPYPDGGYKILQLNDLGYNSPLRPTNLIRLPNGSDPLVYPAPADSIIIVSGPQHGDCFADPNSVQVRTWIDPSPGYACGPDAFFYQVVDSLGWPSLPVWVTVSVTLPSSPFDCNANNVFDPQDVANGTSADCNFDSIPDECQCALDANANGIPDSCETGTTQYCFGYQDIGPCPCGNFAPSGSKLGCRNSLNVGGGLSASGVVSLASDTAVLQASGMPIGGSGLYFQGLDVAGNGNGSAFGDGLVCLGSSIVRLGVVTSANGTSRFPAVGGTPLSQAGLVTSPGSRFYQVWYRDSASFCTSSLFNLTGAVRIIWGQ